MVCVIQKENTVGRYEYNAMNGIRLGQANLITFFSFTKIWISMQAGSHCVCYYKGYS